MPRGDALTGYLDDTRDGTPLKDFQGKPLGGWRYVGTLSNWRTSDGDRVYAVRLAKGAGKSQQWAGGLWLGDGGTLFRGIVLGKAPSPFDYAGRNELDTELLSEAEHWLTLDAEQPEDDDEPEDDDGFDDDESEDDDGFDDDEPEDDDDT